MAGDTFFNASSTRLPGDMKPSLPNVLEVYRLAEEYKLEKVVPPVGRNSQVGMMHYKCLRPMDGSSEPFWDTFVDTNCLHPTVHRAGLCWNSN